MTRMLGLVGGMAWPSTELYYRRLNVGYHAARGHSHSAPLIIWSFDFEVIEKMQRAEDWPGLAAALGDAGQALARAGASALLLCTNTMHKVYEAVETASGLPVLHIADAVGSHLQSLALTTVGLLGTRFTMNESFYSDRLASRGIRVLTPVGDDAAATDNIIFSELVKGNASDVSRRRMHGVVGRLAAAGAQAVILGCTELGLLADDTDWPVPLVDTVALHADAAIDWLVGEGR